MEKVLSFNLLGRMTILDADLTGLAAPIVCDGAHNAQASRYLAKKLENYRFKKIHYVFSAFHDKNITSILEPIINFSINNNSSWYLYQMAVERAASLVKLKDVLTKTCKNNKFQPNIIDINIKIQDDLSHIFESLKKQSF